jgi:hypothetical protein
MRKRHEGEHRDLHGQHREAMRSMHARHEKEMADMDARHMDEMQAAPGGAAAGADMDQMGEAPQQGAAPPPQVPAAA